jgi:Rho-binding antiterminator
MYGYPIKLEMKSGAVIECTALDTQCNDAREECIKVEIADVESLVILDDIAKLEVCVENPHFQVVSFI